MNKHWLFVHLQCFVFDGTPFCICWCVVNQSLLTHNINRIHSNYFIKRFCVCFCALVSSKAKNNNAPNPQSKNKPSKTHSQPPTTKHNHKSTSNQPFQRHQQRKHCVTRNKEQQSKKQKDEQTTRREQRKDWRDNGSTEDAGKQTNR